MPITRRLRLSDFPKLESYSFSGTNPRRPGSKSPVTSGGKQTARGERAARGGRERGQGCVCLPSPAVGVPRASPAGVPRLESSWHGRPTLEKERERNSAAPNRRAQKVMIRSSSDSSYVSGSPGGSPVSGSEQQPSDPEVHTPSPSLSPVQEPGTLPVAPSRPPQESPPRPGFPHSHPPLRLKKSFEILVRKPTTSKPKPPPRKYFKSDSDPQKSLEERDNSPCPSGPTLPACGQVREGPDGSNVLSSARAGRSGWFCGCCWLF